MTWDGECPPDPVTLAQTPPGPRQLLTQLAEGMEGSGRDSGAPPRAGLPEPGGPPTLKTVGLGCGRGWGQPFPEAAMEPRPGNWLEEKGGSLALQSRG